MHFPEDDDTAEDVLYPEANFETKIWHFPVSTSICIQNVEKNIKRGLSVK
jgi:hypothetical protein